MSRHLIALNSPANKALAKRGVDCAPPYYILEIREPTRTDEQNAALHGLIGQIMKQRTHHNGLRMDMRKWKAMFVQALGEEVEFIPTLDGSSVFPLGLSTKALPKGKFSELIELILAWTAQEGLTVEHFDDARAAA